MLAKNLAEIIGCGAKAEQKNEKKKIGGRS